MRRKFGHLRFFNLASAIMVVGLLFQLAVASAQPESTQDVSQLLSNYKEEILLHTDGPLFVTGDYLHFSLFCRDVSTGLLSGLSRVAYVELLDGDNNIVAQEIVELRDGMGNGDIMLPFTSATGNYWLRAYTRWMRNFSVEAFAHHSITIINPFKPLQAEGSAKMPSPSSVENAANTDSGLEMTIATDKESYQPRSAVTLDLLNEDERFSKAVVAVSVSKVPEFYTPPLPEFVKEQREDYSDEVLLPEIKGQLVTGSVQGVEASGKGKLVFMSVTGKLPGFFSSRAGKDGKIFFEVLDFYGDGEIHLQSGETGGAIDVMLESPFEARKANLTAQPLVINQEWQQYIEELSQNMQIRSVYSDVLPDHNLLPVTDTLPFYGIPDQRYFLDDYTRFPLMEEVLREYVSGIMLRKRSGGYYFKMIDLEKQATMEEDPLILYDGLPVSDANKIVEIDPRLVKRIDVVSRKSYLGEAVFSGIASFHTYDGDLKGLDKSVINEARPFKGLQVPHQYKFPVYDSEVRKESPLPDFRTTLYWNPQLTVDGQTQVQFYTGDDTGRYLLTIRGLTADGRRVEARKILNVEK